MTSVASVPTIAPEGRRQSVSALKAETHRESQSQREPINNQLFDLFYEELLTQLMESGELQEKIPTEFMQLQSDLQRVEYLIQLRPLVREFRIKSKQTLRLSRIG